MFKRFTKRFYENAKHSVKHLVVMPLNSEEFKEAYPLHSEAIEILNSRIKITPNNSFISSLPSLRRDISSAYSFYKELQFSPRVFEKSLRVFSAVYAHEATHLKQMDLDIDLLCTTVLYRGVNSLSKDNFIASYLSNQIKGIYYQKEHGADLVMYNQTLVLPSDLGREFILQPTDNPRHPDTDTRDDYVIKRGKPNPAPRLLELFKIDEAQRRVKGLN